MKTILTFLIAVSSLTCYAQKPKTTLEATVQSPPKPDSVIVAVNEFQMEKLASLEKQLQEMQKQWNQSIELITGVPVDKIAELKPNAGYFVIILKRKE